MQQKHFKIGTRVFRGLTGWVIFQPAKWREGNRESVREAARDHKRVRNALSSGCCWIAEREGKKKRLSYVWRHISSGVTLTSHITWWWMDSSVYRASKQTKQMRAALLIETGTQKPPRWVWSMSTFSRYTQYNTFFAFLRRIQFSLAYLTCKYICSTVSFCQNFIFKVVFVIFRCFE